MPAERVTLVELLVVVIVLAILAAIAVPVFLAQREKGYAAQVQSALKNAASAVESYATEDNGAYSDFETVPDLAGTMEENGFRVPAWAASFDVVATSTTYCIEIHHASATSGKPWRRATYFASQGAPGPSPDVCPAAAAL